MKFILLLVLIAVASCSVPSKQKGDLIKITGEKKSELMVLHDYEGNPDSTGNFGSFSFDLPKFSSGCFYVQDTLWGSWPAGANRILPFPFKDKVKADYQNGGMFVYFHLTNGNYLVLLPVISEKALSWFEIMPDNKLKLNFGNLGAEKIAGDFPLLSWSVSDDLYQACYNVWENVIHHPEFTINTDWGNIYNFMGVSTQNAFSNYYDQFNNAIQRFRQLDDPSKINVQPERIAIEEVESAGTMASVLKSYGVPNDKLEEMALLNGMTLNERVQAGTLVKIVE